MVVSGPKSGLVDDTVHAENYIRDRVKFCWNVNAAKILEAAVSTQ